jgi:hypothetical protein
MALGLALAQDIASAALDWFVRGDALLQTQQDRPLLAFLNAGKDTFPGGKQYISEPVQGATMNDVPGFFAGYTQDDQLAFTQASNLLRVQYPWKECHAGFIITLTELKQDGISVSDSGATSEHSEIELSRLTGILKNRLADYAESWARAMNLMLWKDGSQDAKQIPGVLSILLEDPTTGTVGGLSQATYPWWRSRVNLALSPSPEDQTVSKFFRNEVIQLSRYGGKPNKVLCGSLFWDALMQEVSEKGIYTQSGFADKGTDIGMNRISAKGIGTYEYDPTLDDLGLAKSSFVLDSRRLKLRPMEGEWNKTLAPARPYQYMVLIKSMTATGGLTCNQLNGMGRYAIA